MRIKVSDTDILMFERNKRALLLSRETCRIFVIADFKIEEGEEVTVKKKWYSKKSESTTTKQKYLTEIEIQSWHSIGKFVGTLTEDACRDFVYKDIYQMRKNWLDFKDMLKGFGMDVQNIKVDPICNCDKRDMPVYEENGKNWCPQCGYEVK